jgi:DGQHR domain-containing protein
MTKARIEPPPKSNSADNEMASPSRADVPALIVHQWLADWDQVGFSDDARRRKPDPYFYLFALDAQLLRRLSNIYRRSADKPRVQDSAVQRAHDPKRSNEIRRFVQSGFPWSELSERQKGAGAYQDLMMPGWLSTAVIANILPKGARRDGALIADKDIVQIKKNGTQHAFLTLPVGVFNEDWNPETPPLEIIDGQHRLWAFERDENLNGEFEVPVVAFYDLDVTWQAYLFYMINIKPKRINPSLAFDLYPILRIQDWLERSAGGPAIYRETRAQELTEVLWSHPESPWRGRINMLGESKGGQVTQAAFIRSLMASYVKRWGSGEENIGGLFGAELHADASDVLQWARPQQAAFLVNVWHSLAMSLKGCKADWAKKIRDVSKERDLPFDNREMHLDPAFASNYSLLATDQGVRGVLQVTNDMTFVAADELNLAAWEWDGELDEDATSDTGVTKALRTLRKQPVTGYTKAITESLATFDWRASSTPDISESERRAQMVYKGSSGYKEIRRQLLQCLRGASDKSVAKTAKDIISRLGY